MQANQGSFEPLTVAAGGGPGAFSLFCRPRPPNRVAPMPGDVTHAPHACNGDATPSPQLSRIRTGPGAVAVAALRASVSAPSSPAFRDALPRAPGPSSCMPYPPHARSRTATDPASLEPLPHGLSRDVGAAHSGLLSAESPSCSGWSGLDACASSTDFDAESSLIPAAPPTVPSHEAGAGLYHTMHARTMPPAAAPNTGVSTLTWQPVADSSERDISEEFDVTMVLGDLNYRCAVCTRRALLRLHSRVVWCGRDLHKGSELCVNCVDGSPRTQDRAGARGGAEGSGAFRGDVAAQRALFAHDQLRVAMAASHPESHPLQPFSEATTGDGRMPFPPTYKFKTGIPGDRYSSKRTPSWTDRVLWRCNYEINGAAAVAAARYACMVQLRLSDHRPVIAALRLQLRHSGALVDTCTAAAGGLSGCRNVATGAERGGRTLRRWLAEATARLRVLKAGPEVMVAEGECAPLRRNLELLNNGGLGDEYSSPAMMHGDGRGWGARAAGEIERGLRASQSVPRRMRLGAAVPL